MKTRELEKPDGTRLFFILISALLFCSVLFFNSYSYADESITSTDQDFVTTIDGVTYYCEIDNVDGIEKVCINSISTTKKSLTVPQSINGKPVFCFMAEAENGKWTVENLNFASSKNITHVFVDEVMLTSLNVIGCSNLHTLTCCETGLSSLDLSGCTSLYRLECDDNNLKSLDLSQCPNLDNIICGMNQLTSLDLSKCTKLIKVDCYENKLSSLILPKSVQRVFCWDNNLTKFEVAQYPNLTWLKCENNFISNTKAIESWLKQNGHSGSVLPQKKQQSSTEGWKKSGNRWWYQYGDGSYAKGLTTIGSTKYYFDKSGWMKTGWQHATGNSDWYYFNSNGAMKTGWLKSGGKWYYLNSDGVMHKGKIALSGKTYFLNSSGMMQTGWVKDSGNWYYTNGSGVMQTGWKKVGGKWYYLDPTTGIMKTGKVTLKDGTYFLNASGAMRTGWIKDAGKWYYANSSGKMLTNKWISGTYWVGADGVMATSTWVDNGKYYVDGNGKWVKGKKK